MTAAPRLALCLCLLGAAACSASPGATDAGVRDSGASDAASTTDGGAPSDAVVGTFQVHLVPPTDAGAGYTSVVGRVQDGPTPEQVIWELALADGACRLLTPRVPFCSAPCGGAAACAADDTCQPTPCRSPWARCASPACAPPRARRASTSPRWRTPTSSRAPPCPSPRSTRATRSARPPRAALERPFTLAARGIAPLTLAESTVRVATGEAVALRWNAPTQTGLRVRVSLDISHHGGTRGKIECAADDTGALTIAAPLITRLVALGVAGFPTIIVSRESVGEAALRAGRVLLSVASTVEVPVEIPNVRSCTENSECPSGTCRPDLRCE